MAASIGARPLLLKSSLFSRSTCILCRQCQTAVNTSERKPRGQIEIPKRIKRDSVSILEALASTVGKDPSGPSYQFIDDPALIPTSAFQKRILLLSKASGKRTARYMINEFRNTFDHDAGAPHIQAYMPDEVEYKYKDASQEALQERISRREVEDAMEIYNRLLDEGKEINSDLKLSYLELLCVFGCKDPAPKLLMEEKLFKDELSEGSEVGKTQISMDPADDVFQSLPEKNEDAYNWIVRCLVKAGNPKGYKYYNEMREGNIPVHLGTYNDIIDSMVRMQKDKWNSITNYLTQMKEDGVSPNIETFHSVLRAIDKTKGVDLQLKVPSILAEMKVLGIEPTLQTWALVLGAKQTLQHINFRGRFKKDESAIVGDIEQIIDYIMEDLENIKIHHFKENFFLKAVLECYKFRDAEVAIKLFDLKEKLGNKYIITSLTDEAFFNDDLLKVVSGSETTEVVMEIYSKLCPYLHTPANDTVLRILDNVDMYREYKHVFQLWTDNVDMHKSLPGDKVMEVFMRLFLSEHVPEEMSTQFGQLAKDMYDKKIKGLPHMYNRPFVALLVDVFLKHNELDHAWDLMIQAYKSGQMIFRPKNLNNLLTLSIQNGDAERIMEFCDLPEDVTRLILDRTIITENMDVLEKLLDKSQMEKMNHFLNRV